MNVADFVDANIEEKLAALEHDEEELLTETTAIDPSMFLPPEEQEVHDEIVNAQGVLREVSRVKKGLTTTSTTSGRAGGRGHASGAPRGLGCRHGDRQGEGRERQDAAPQPDAKHDARPADPFMDEEDNEEGEDRSRSRSRRRPGWDSADPVAACRRGTKPRGTPRTGNPSKLLLCVVIDRP